MKDEEAKNPANEGLLGHYRILKLLGAGGMGEVFLAEDALLNRKVALKILPESFAADSGRLSRFQREARAISALNHPNILTIHEFGTSENGVLFLATELVEGETLREKIEDGEMSLTDTLNIVEQIAFALTAAHAAGIVHRDVKPENIMIRADGIVKVLDFGIAKLVAPPADFVDTEGDTLAKMMTQTKPGLIIGTLNYMSPEQVRGRQTLDARSDIFSLGVCLYEMLTGKSPFEKPTSSDVIAAILTENPPPVSQTRPDAPAELGRIIGKALKKNIDERYQTSKDFLLDIKSLKRELEFPSNPKPATTAGNETRHTNKEEIRVTNPPPIRRFSLVRAIGVFLIASLTISGMWWFYSKSNFQTGTLPSSYLNTVEVVNWRSSPGEVYSVGSFSPDGKIIAFASTRSGAKNIWVKQLAGGEAVQITKDEFGNQSPIWSPNGDEIAFFSTRGGSPGVWRMSSFGGTPTFIKTIEDGSIVLRRWSKKDVIYYEAKQNLFALDIKSAQSSQLTNLTAKVNANTISISPDEEQIAYVTFENEQYAVWTVSLRGGAPRQIVGTPSEIRKTIWHTDGKRVLYSQMVGGIFQIFAADASGGIPAQITGGDKDALALDVSADGTKILYGSSKEESDVWGVNVEKGEEFSFAADIDSELWASPAPDGKKIAFQSIKNLSQGDKIFSGAILTKLTESADAQPFQLVASGFLPTWSPDSKQMAFMRLSGETYNLWTIRAAGGEEKQLTTDGLPSIEFTLLPYNRMQTSSFSWSPDGRKIAYISNRSGQRNIWLVDTDGSGNSQLTNNADSNLFVSCPLWSSDGERLAYSAKLNKALADGQNFYAASIIDVKTKNTKNLVQSENFQRLLGWSPSDKELLLAAIYNKSGALAGSPMEVSIFQVNIATGEQRQIAKIESAYLYNIYLSSDKKMLAYVSKKDGKDNIWIMRLDNSGEARKLTANNDPKLYFSSLAWSADNRAVYFGKQTRYSLLSMVTSFK